MSYRVSTQVSDGAVSAIARKLHDRSLWLIPHRVPLLRPLVPPYEPLLLQLLQEFYILKTEDCVSDETLDLSETSETKILVIYCFVWNKNCFLVVLSETKILLFCLKQKLFTCCFVWNKKSGYLLFCLKQKLFSCFVWNKKNLVIWCFVWNKNCFLVSSETKNLFILLFWNIKRFSCFV